MSNLLSAISLSILFMFGVSTAAKAEDKSMEQKHVIESAICNLEAPKVLILKTSPSFYSNYIKKAIPGADKTKEATVQDVEYLTGMLWPPFKNHLLVSKTDAGEWDYREKLKIQKNGSFSVEYFDYIVKVKYVIKGIVSDKTATIGSISAEVISE